jgi:poly-beta-1,6-N-acetyl-D-glucosamine N-deacetylase
MIILTYHYFAEVGGSKLSCSSDELRRQLDYLSRRCTVVPLLEGLRTIERGEPLPPRTIAITVDDCDLSFYELGWPIFQQFRVPLLCNVITNQFGRTLGASKQRALLGRRGIEALVASGLVTLGSHSATHPRLNQLPAEDLTSELTESRRVVQSIQGHCDVFCYPYGSMSVVTADTERVMVESGYRYALTTCGGRVGPGTDRLRIGRLNIVRGIGPSLLPWYANGTVGSLLSAIKRLRGERFYCRHSSAGRLHTEGFSRDMR